MRRALPLLLGLLAAAHAGAEPEGPAPVNDQPVMALAAQTVALDTPVAIDRLSVHTFRDGRLVPVPFQIDEMDVHGMVWFPDSGFQLEGRRGIFDASDQLLFMLSDASPTPLPERQAGGGPVRELVLQDGAGQKRYVYLMIDNDERSERFYVLHDPSSGVTRTDSYLLTTDPDNELNWQFLGYEGYRGPPDASIIDNLRMLMSGGVLVRFARMTLDNDNLQPRQTGFRIGPIRSVLHLETRIVFGGLPMMKMHVQAMRYANHFEAHTYARIPGIYRATVKQPRVSVSIDGNAHQGALVRTALGGSARGTVDGKLDDQERMMLERGLTSDQGWILFDSRRGFALMTMLNVPESLEGIPLKLIYRDEKSSDREGRFPGNLPELGYTLEGWPPEDELRFSLQVFFDSSLEGVNPADYANTRTGRTIGVTVNPPALP
ncbi:MAG: hypothetical protein ACPG43_06210 [Alcanivoracaceae bacterium]